MVLFEAKRRAPVAEPASAAERRKAAWSARRERFWMVSVYTISFVFIAMVTAEFIYAKSVSALSPATEVTFTNGQVTHSAGAGCGWRSAPLPAKESGTRVRFWLYQKPDGKIATVFDACEICGAVGFYKSGQRRGVQELRCADQSAVGRHGGGLQSGAAEGDADRRRGHHSGGGHRGRKPHVRATVTDVRATGLRIIPAAEAAQAAGGRSDDAWASRWRRR